MMRRTRILGLTFILLTAGCGDDSGGPSTIGELTRAQLTRACVVSMACGVQVRPRVHNCVAFYNDVLRELGLGPVWDKIYSCVNNASNCMDVAACFGPGETCDQSYRASCAGNATRSCDLQDNKVYSEDCSAAGLACLVDPANPFAAKCGCDPASFPTSCVGDYRIRCEGNEVSARNCAAFGFVCRDADCRPPETGDDCEPQGFPQSCDGSVVVRCNQGKIARYDCAQNLINRACDTAGCVKSSDECNDDFNRCNGATLEACIDGSWESIDCAAFGLGPCVDGATSANCSMP